jgi:hypothetical protein
MPPKVKFVSPLNVGMYFDDDKHISWKIGKVIGEFKTKQISLSIVYFKLGCFKHNQILRLERINDDDLTFKKLFKTSTTRLQLGQPFKLVK